MRVSGSMNILVTGGDGFIGSHLTQLLLSSGHKVHVVDNLSLNGNMNNIRDFSEDLNFSFTNCSVTDPVAVKNIFLNFKPELVFHLAAESHVDNSIKNPQLFLESNVLGTFNLLSIGQEYLAQCNDQHIINSFKFIHVSTDEVFGDIGHRDIKFTEMSRYDPSSPYSASKASSDHLIRAWFRTYSFPAIITNCSNNYGPRQFPEKLIPKTIHSALQGNKIEVYGDGLQERDWLWVGDHCRALIAVAYDGEIGKSYNIGGDNCRTNISVVEQICDIMNKKIVSKPNGLTDFRSLIEPVDDRLGHDRKYAIDATKIKQELGWYPAKDFGSGLGETIDWYQNNRLWPWD